MGVKYPKGSSPVYPPRDWTCPSCDKYHSKAHFAFKGQAGKKGSETWVMKDREQKNDSCKQTGPMLLEDGLTQGLFCPHCGWQEHIINIIKETGITMNKLKGWKSIVRPDCCIKKCTKKADYTNNEMHFCKDHYKLMK